MIAFSLQVVVDAPTDPVDMTGVPEYFRIAIQPLVDAVFRGESEDYFRGVLDFARSVAPAMQPSIPGHGL